MNMSMTVHQQQFYPPRRALRSRLVNILAIMLLCSTISTGQTQIYPSGRDTRPSANGFVDQGGVGLIKPFEPFDFTSPVGTSANLMITGNIGGGKHFQADIPYTTASAFQQPLQSSYLDSFRRYTMDNDLTLQTPLAYTPFYSPTTTVTHTRPGRASVVTAADLSSTLLGTTVSAPENRSKTSMINIEQIQTQDTTLPNIERITVPDNAMSTNETYLRQPWQMPLADSEAMMRQVDIPAIFSHRRQEAEADTFESRPEQDQDTVTPPDLTQRPDFDFEAEPSSDTEDVYMNSPSANQASLITPDIQQDIEQARTVLDTLGSLDEMTLETSMPDESLLVSDDNDPTTIPSAGALPADISLNAFHEAKYDTFLKAGQSYLKQGQFQKANSAYTLAGVYRPNDAEAWAGRSLALLAEGEYAGSALFLRRALHTVPDYAQVKIDLPALIGGTDAVSRHVKSLKSYQDNPNKPELHNLLVYIYLQINDLGLAQEILEKTTPLRPNDTVVKALQAALIKAME